jgi:cytochrome c oxidase cbb3-type subunit IV
MEKEILQRIDGIGVYGVVSICIFFGFFTGMIVWAFAQKKNYLNKMSALPLDGGETNSNEKN